LAPIMRPCQTRVKNRTGDFYRLRRIDPGADPKIRLSPPHLTRCGGLGNDRVITSSGGVLMAEPCSGSDAVVKAENAALEMYRFAALMLGSETEAVRLVEDTVAAVEVDPCADPCAAKGLVRDRVLHGALEILHRQDPASFHQVPAAAPASSCLEDEDAPPLSAPELSALVEGAGRRSLRDWLNRLSAAQRAVFVQRAVLGQDNAATANAINGLARPAIWTADAVGRLFRQALCSLASSLVHSAPAIQA
jgi:DNA-directed RNA polymerase specialized sigma24 family protein